MLTEELKNKIVESIRRADPYKIILFGSYASGKPGKDSDIDLFIVTKEEKIPENYANKIAIKLKISRYVDVIRREYPVDLIVQTKAMYEKFIKSGSLFSKEIISKGQILYEAN